MAKTKHTSKQNRSLHPTGFQSFSSLHPTLYFPSSLFKVLLSVASGHPEGFDYGLYNIAPCDCVDPEAPSRHNIWHTRSYVPEATPGESVPHPDLLEGMIACISSSHCNEIKTWIHVKALHRMNDWIVASHLLILL